MGAFSYSHSLLAPNLYIGRYASIGPKIQWGGEDHPTHWASTFPITYDEKPLPGVGAYFAEHGCEIKREPFVSAVAPMTIGHDVWIGFGAFIASGVRIGHGAVVAAGAVVTKDVAPYSVVGGVPAKVIRMRFSDDTVERMLKSQWWLYEPKDFAPIKLSAPLTFLDRFEEAVAAGSFKPAAFEPLQGEEMIAAVTGPQPEG
jgi:acetyltransferase-like isoleucine patch superfamily enzyme